MRRAGTIAALLLTTAISVYADSKTYLVYLNKIANPRVYFNAVGKLTMAQAGGQPYRITDIYLDRSGKYATAAITPTAAEQTQLNNLVSNGWIKLLFDVSVIEYYNPVTGGTERKVIRTDYDSLPSDFDVQISTP